MITAVKCIFIFDNKKPGQICPPPPIQLGISIFWYNNCHVSWSIYNRIDVFVTFTKLKMSLFYSLLSVCLLIASLEIWLFFTRRSLKMLMSIKFGWPSTTEVSAVTVLVSLSILRNHDENTKNWAGATALFRIADPAFWTDPDFWRVMYCI